jgi:hypothetical protein
MSTQVLICRLSLHHYPNSPQTALQTSQRESSVKPRGGVSGLFCGAAMAAPREEQAKSGPESGPAFEAGRTTGVLRLKAEAPRRGKAQPPTHAGILELMPGLRALSHDGDAGCRKGTS